MALLYDGDYCDLKKNDNDKYYLITFKANNENRLNLDSLANLEKILDIVEKATDDYFMIVQSSNKYWSNGIDLKWVHQNKESGATLMNRFSTLMARILIFPIPTIALINGHCFGGGLMFSMAFDYRVMITERGWLCLPAINLQIILPNSFFSLLLAKIGDTKSYREVTLLGKRYGGLDAKALRLVDEAIESKQSLQYCVDFGNQVRGKNREAYKNIKKEMYLDVYNKLIQTNVALNVFEKNSKL